MNISKKMLLPLGAFAILGACAPYPPLTPPTNPQAAPELTAEQKQKAITDKKQRDLEKRRKLARDKKRTAARRSAARRSAAKKKTVSSSSRPKPRASTPAVPKKPARPNYPTASSVPGKPGFVFNPYTHNIVDVKGIGSGKLCRDPEDGNSTHKFRVP